MQALVVDKSGVIYAATNPDGKVYKIEHRASSAEKGSGDKKSTDKTTPDSGWSSSVYFEPGTKYIWDLALDDSGNLYVATGDHGEIFRVTPKGDHSVFFKSDEAHIRVMAFESQGQSDCGFGRQRSGLSSLSQRRRVRPLQRAEERNHRPGHRQNRKHLRRRCRRKTWRHNRAEFPLDANLDSNFSIPFEYRAAGRYRDHRRSRQHATRIDELPHPRCRGRGRIGDLSHRARRLSQPGVEFSRGHRVRPRL